MAMYKTGSGRGQSSSKSKKFMSGSYPTYGKGSMMKGSTTKMYPETKGRKYSKNKRMKVGSY